jgi:soluble lytic murein transglycosylase-like protein
MTRAPFLAVLKMVSNPALFRTLGCLGVLAALAACSGQAPRIDQTQEAVRYQARARGNYHPPGPPEDPWRPYITEASRKFDVPERWIREVMRVESGGQMYQNGSLITSRAGAMGLMQVMPETYDELQARYDLSDDAYDPHNNILAGTAYLREMYDIYGSPGFLAAYNAGPKRLDDYLANMRPLPDETRRYVAMIGPYVMDSAPVNRSAAEQYAMNVLPTDIPPGLRYGGRTIQLAQARPTSGRAPRGSVRST